MRGKILLIALLFLVCFSPAQGQSARFNINYVTSFDNINHPEVAYWFFSKDMLNPVRYKGKIDSLSKNGKYTFLFLTARNGINFYDAPAMHPIFKDLVDYAHSKGLKIGLQIWDNRSPVAIENTERLIQEGEITLDATGGGNYTTKARHSRDMKILLKSELFKVYAFKKVADGFYDPSTLKDITGECKSEVTKETVIMSINAGAALSGYTAYILTQHYYNFSSNHSADAVARLSNGLKSYADIPFDGVGLDEFTNLRVATTWELKKANEAFRERSYSLAMAAEFKNNTGMDLKRSLFDMRYAPAGNPAVRIKAINAYMNTMRSGTMNLERTIYQKGKEYFGPATFIGLHDTHHNSLDGDEIWQTGLNWWNVPRDYGHTDESSPTPTQLGIGMGYKMNVMYNMYYNKSLDNIVTKALTDLRYGIRTHYHAINDIQGWGVSVEKPDALQQINKVENAARLLNRFNPPFPKVKLLIVFGMEALSNWYPNEAQRGLSDINDKLMIEEKANQLWDAGYRDALVPTDMINDGRLKLDAEGKPVLQGHRFDAVVFLYPQYAKPAAIEFLEAYVKKGGKLMVEGNATYDFTGNDISARWQNISNKATVNGYSVEGISQLGVIKEAVNDGALNEDGSYTFTNIASLSNDAPGHFQFTQSGNTYSATYTQLAAIKVDEKGRVIKFAATGFSELKKNGETVFSLNKPADIFWEIKNGQANITIADETKTVKPVINKL
jgi:hypothetical protein